MNTPHCEICLIELLLTAQVTIRIGANYGSAKIQLKMMKIPAEFMEPSPIPHNEASNMGLLGAEDSASLRRGSLDNPKPGFKPARRREERRQRPQRHTTVVLASDKVEAKAALVKGESTGGLNRALHLQTSASISRWNSVSITSITNHKDLRGSSEASEATATTPSTPVHFQTVTTSGFLPSAASVVRALSPLLTPAFVAANSMTQRAHRIRHAHEQLRPTSPITAEDEYVQLKLGPKELPFMTQDDFEQQYDIVQKIGEGWFSRVYLTEHRSTRHELVLKAINSKNMSVDEFLREFRHSVMLGAHKNILTVFPDLVFSIEGQCCMFASEYAPLGDLTSNVNDLGIGEVNSKRVAKQIGSALDWVHSKNWCHLDVKLDNILVFKSDFTKVKLCDFGSVRTQGDIVIKKNELLPYCPPELVAKHANEYYQVDRVQDVFQFGIVVFFCLFGILPWQRADPSADPNFAEFCAWRRKRTSKIPKNFKPLSSRAHKLFKKLLDPDPERRLRLSELPKLTGEDIKWLRKTGASKSLLSNPDIRHLDSSTTAAQFLSDGISQLTMGSFKSVHSNALEKNKSLYTLLQHGVETTVDRSQKNSRIINWIQNGCASDSLEDLDSIGVNSNGREAKSGSISSSGGCSYTKVEETTEIKNKDELLCSDGDDDAGNNDHDRFSSTYVTDM